MFHNGAKTYSKSQLSRVFWSVNHVKSMYDQKHPKFCLIFCWKTRISYVPNGKQNIPCVFLTKIRLNLCRDNPFNTATIKRDILNLIFYCEKWIWFRHWNGFDPIVCIFLWWDRNGYVVTMKKELCILYYVLYYVQQNFVCLIFFSRSSCMLLIYLKCQRLNYERQMIKKEQILQKEFFVFYVLVLW